MERIVTEVLVIGGGPAGYVAAIRAGQLGFKTVLVEQKALGGTCLNVGCIPSKSLIHVAESFYQACSPSPFGLRVAGANLDVPMAVAWKDGIVQRLANGVSNLLKKQKVRVLKGRAEIRDGKSCIVSMDGGLQVLIETTHLVLAMGSAPAELKALPFGGAVISSADALGLTEVPKHLSVVGAGYIGIELGTAFAKLGAEVTMIEAAKRILPAWDAELTRPITKRLKDLGVKVMTESLATGLSPEGEQLLVAQAETGVTTAITSEKVLVAIGRRPCTEGSGLTRLDLDMNGPFVRIDRHCSTSMRNVWAIGDLTGEPMLAHRAMAQAKMVAERIAGMAVEFDHAAIPAICFSDPEIVSVGLLPAEAAAAGHAAMVTAFPFAGNGRALSQNDDSGFVRVVARADTKQILGVQAVGREVSELSTAFSLAIEMGALLEDITGTIHAHPTRGEALQEAAFGGLGKMLHS